MPQAFKFRLERLLEVRRLREEIAQRDLALAARQVREQNDKLLRLLNEEDAEKQALRAMKLNVIDVPKLRMREGYLNALEQRVRQEYERLQHLVGVEIEKRRALIEARKTVRILERYRERRLRAHTYEAGRQEQKFLDEVGQRAIQHVDLRSVS